MADTKISALTALLGVDIADLDEFVVVDKSDVTMAASGTDKRMTFAELIAAIQRRDLGLDLFSATSSLMP